MQILETNWHLADLEDIVIFSQFQVDCVRHQEEVREKAPMRTPDAIYESLGAISYMRPEFMSRVKDKVKLKQARITALLTPWWKVCGGADGGMA